MCCFAQSVRWVARTRIFARMVRPGVQTLVYQMEYGSDVANAMILPLPVALPAREDSVRFQSLQAYGHFFSDLEKAFPVKEKRIASPMPTSRAIDEDSKLVVHEVGDYVASFVPRVSDFGRLDPQFVIPRETWNRLPEYHDYGFAVFQLKALEGSVHPMALEFETRLGERLFFPTVHIHDGEVHAEEHFDHMLYAQEPAWDRHVGWYRGEDARDPATNMVRSQGVAKHYCNIGLSGGVLDGNALIHRRQLLGNLGNHDVTYRLAGMGGGVGTGRHWGWYPVGGLAVVAGLGWLFQRRNRMRALRDE